MGDKDCSKITLLAFKYSVPVLFGYIPLGIAFGFLLVQSGLHWAFALAMSVFVYSGASQFLLIGLITSAVPVAEVAITMLLLNLRHSFYGLSLFQNFKGTSWAKPYLIFSMTDETFALISTHTVQPQDKRRLYFTISALDHFYWIAGSLTGALAGTYFTVTYKGLDFALTALFVVLVIEQYKKIRSKRPFTVAAFVGILGLILLPSSYMLLGTIICSMILLFFFRPEQKGGGTA
jgi:4-azaleucine resistance transporter AzlC